MTTSELYPIEELFPLPSPTIEQPPTPTMVSGTSPRMDDEILDFKAIDGQLEKLCSHISVLGSQQRETNKLLSQIVTQRLHQAQISTSVSLSNSFPGFVYLKHKRMAILVGLSDKQSRKVWCMTCNKRVLVRKSPNGAESLCGHLVSCVVCARDTLESLARCSSCVTPSVKSLSSDTNEICPACSSQLSMITIVDETIRKLQQEAFVLVNVSDEVQCPHNGIRHQDLSSMLVGKKRRLDDLTDSPNMKRVPENVSPTDPGYPFQTVISPVVGIGKRALQVGSKVLSRMTNFQDDGYEFFL